MTYKIGDLKRSASTSQFMITLEQKASTTARFKKGDQTIKPLSIPFLLDFQGHIYRIESYDSGTTFAVTRDGEAVEKDCPSVAFAFGKLTKHVLVDLSFAEELGPQQTSLDSIDKDFIESVAGYLANSPVVSKDAAKPLGTFVELVTNRIFEPDGEKTE